MEDLVPVDILSDLSTVTTVPKKSLEKLIKQENWLICNALQESLL